MSEGREFQWRLQPRPIRNQSPAFSYHDNGSAPTLKLTVVFKALVAVQRHSVGMGSSIRALTRPAAETAKTFCQSVCLKKGDNISYQLQQKDKWKVSDKMIESKVFTGQEIKNKTKFKHIKQSNFFSFSS